MSFLSNLGAGLGAAGGAAGGLGHLLGADPSRISGIADRIGNASNLIAQGGGAAPAYQAPQAPQAPQAGAPGAGSFSNVMQFLTPDSLQHIRAMFGGYGQ